MPKRVARLPNLARYGCCIAVLVACSSEDDGNLFQPRPATATVDSTMSTVSATSVTTGMGTVTTTSTNGAATGTTGMGGTSSTGGSFGNGGSGSMGGDQGSGGTGGAGGSAGGTSASGGVGGTGGAGTGGSQQTTDGAGAGGEGGVGGESGCDGVTVMPQATTVFILLDRSSSMEDDGFWTPVKDGVFGSVMLLADRMRFGVATFTGQVGLTCPLEWDATASVELNYANEVFSMLDPLQPPDPDLVKGETPTPSAVAAVRSALANDLPPGDTYLLLITDGDPDFCDDGKPDCAGDALVYQLQQAYLEGIQTRVFNIKGGAASAARLQAFARAGSGASVRGDAASIYSTCEPESQWLNRLTGLGRGKGEALGAYVPLAPAGSFVTLDPSNALALEAEFAAQTAELLSCHFALSDGVILPGQEENIAVRLGSQTLVLNDPDGWRLHDGNLFEITGAACDQYRSPNGPRVRIRFDCSVLEP